MNYFFIKLMINLFTYLFTTFGQCNYQSINQFIREKHQHYKEEHYTKE